MVDCCSFNRKKNRSILSVHFQHQ